MLANIYLAGLSVEKNHEQYMYWLGQSAEKGYPPANYLMGMAYLYGDKSMAAGYLKAAADKEHAASMHMLGTMYARGVGVAKNTDEAVRWFRLARAQGYPVPDQLLTQSGVEASLKEGNTARKREKLVHEIQQRLINLGYRPVPADGLYEKKHAMPLSLFNKKRFETGWAGNLSVA